MLQKNSRTKKSLELPTNSKEVQFQLLVIPVRLKNSCVVMKKTVRLKIIIQSSWQTWAIFTIFSSVVQVICYSLEIYLSFTIVSTEHLTIKAKIELSNSYSLYHDNILNTFMNFLGDPGAASWDDAIFSGERYFWA